MEVIAVSNEIGMYPCPVVARQRQHRSTRRGRSGAERVAETRFRLAPLALVTGLPGAGKTAR
jgi:hypothetical protein